jgi:putative transcriptional regulator
MSARTPPMSAGPRAVTPSHHPADDVLVEYVAGTAGGATALALACHVSLCGRLAALEAVGGALLEGGAAVSLPPDALARALAAVDGPSSSDALADDASPAPATPAFLAPYGLPGPLARALAAMGRGARWRFSVPGVRVISLPIEPASGTTRVRLVAFAPGVTIPPHDHGGTEHVVVFTGAIEEDGRRFARGDIATREAGERHEQHIAAGEPCVALLVNEGPLLPLTLRGRLLLAFARA